MEQEYSKQEMFEWLKSFMIENYWYDSHVPQQARSIFSTICMVWNIDADTADCDWMLNELWTCAGVDEIEIDYDEFENFMLAWIV